MGMRNLISKQTLCADVADENTKIHSFLEILLIAKWFVTAMYSLSFPIFAMIPHIVHNIMKHEKLYVSLEKKYHYITFSSFFVQWEHTINAKNSVLKTLDL